MYKHLFISLLTLSFIGKTYAQESQAPEFSSITYMGLTGKLADMPDAGFSWRNMFKTKQPEDKAMQEHKAIITPSKTDHKPDEALQKTYTGSTTDIEILSVWSGLKSKYLRSDNNLAVGPNHVVQMINSNAFSSIIRVWNKAGELLVDKKYFYDLTGELDYGDPNIIYDQQADRFVISFLYSGIANKLILCASETSDPTGAWHYYIINTPYGFPDYEKLAVWGDSYILTTAAGKPVVYVINRAEVLSGNITSPVLWFKPYRIPNIGWQGCSPVNQTGSTDVPADEPAIIARVIDDAWFAPEPAIDKLELFALDIHWDAPETSTMSAPISIPITSYNSDLCGFNANSCLEQKDTEIKLWPVSNFITDKAQYRNFGAYQSIVCSHVCNADGDGNAGVRWYELRKESGSEWSIYQESTYQPTDDHRWISSVTINDEGTIAMGYNITSEDLYPGIRITGRTDCDALNTMAEEVIAKEGTSHNFTLNYGDYNGIVTDPVDGSFWFTAQFNSSPHWSTAVIHFTIEGCDDEKLQLSNTPGVFTIHPTLANQYIEIRMQTIQAYDATITVTDMYGNVMLSEKHYFTSDNNTLTLNASGLVPGTYIVNMLWGSLTETVTIIVQH
jgi:hypothetical protein